MWCEAENNSILIATECTQVYMCWVDAYIESRYIVDPVHAGHSSQLSMLLPLLLLSALQLHQGEGCALLCCGVVRQVCSVRLACDYPAH